MILAVDSYYSGTIAHTVAITFQDWQDASYSEVYAVLGQVEEAYIPGEFYKRELPCILDVLEKVELNRLEAIVIDGYVYLDDTGKPGLGMHLYKRLGEMIPVIGVAKTGFKTVDALQEKITRGESQNPLFVSSAGIDLQTAASRVRSMAGSHRIPDLLKKLDALTREL